MAEATLDTNDAAELAALQDAARAIERARLKQIGSFHIAMVLGAITLWGAALTWSQWSGSTLASLVALGNAVVAGFVIVGTIHEWGHFTGARLSGAASPVFEEPKRHYFMFDFPMDQNDTQQFLWMSWGGILAPWIPVVFALGLVPLETLSGAALFATLFSRAVAVAVFEAPIARAVAEGGDPAAELGKAATGGGLDRGRRMGMITGFACFALVWLVA